MLSNNGNGTDSDPNGDTLQVLDEIKATTQGGLVIIEDDGVGLGQELLGPLRADLLGAQAG